MTDGSMNKDHESSILCGIYRASVTLDSSVIDSSVTLIHGYC